MSVTHEPFQRFAGDTWKFEASLHGDDGGALDLTGAEIAWTVREALTGALVLQLTLGDGITISGDPTEGNAIILVSPERTGALAAGDYIDTIRVTFPSGLVTTQATGAIAVLPNVPPVAESPAARLEALKAARYSGVMAVQFGDEKVTYRSDKELLAAITALEAEVAPAASQNVVVRSAKGW
ncbi:MAG: hypothetical protein WBW73_14705 [Rhodoplanes sp.]